MGKKTDTKPRKFYQKIIPARQDEKEECEEKADEADGEKQSKTKDDPKPVPLFKLFQFATRFEIFLIVFGCLMGCLSGFGMPCLVILFGSLTNAFVYNSILTDIAANKSLTNQTITNQTQNGTLNHVPVGTQLDFLHEVQIFGLYTCILGIIQLSAGYVMVSCLNTAAERQIFRIRISFLKSVLKQDISWYDERSVGEFSSRSIADLNKLQDGIGEKLGMFIFFMTNFIADIIIAFVYGWKLTLVILSVMPILTLATAAFMKIQTSITNEELKAYSYAGSIAEEVFGALKTVLAFGGEEKEIDRFQAKLIHAQNAAIKRGLVCGIGTGVTWLITYGSFALAFWYGVKLYVDSVLDKTYEYSASTIIIVFFSALMGAMTVGQASPFMEAINIARVAAATVYSVIHRVPLIDSSSIKGERPSCMVGDIHFKNVHFNYPSRKEVPVLCGLNLRITSGETVAVVGKSGCGKSTLFQLLQRFYDTTSGSVKVDGHDVRKLNVRWLRERLGVVSQEPILFGMTIRENISLGYEGVTFEQIQQAAIAANAHKFISKLPKKYDTLVGDRGSQLSGGQKQRIAIARALVKNPRILLLDEATSALDTESESVVQAALDKACNGRTTLIVAHRLSTVRNADRIVVLNDGEVIEEGSHDGLIAKKGVYFELVQNQQFAEEDVATDAVIEGPEIIGDGDAIVDKKFFHRRPTQGSLINSTINIDDDAIPFEYEKDEELKPSVLRILKLNSNEWPYILFGCIGAIGFGCTTPCYALLFGDIMGVLSIMDTNKARSESEFYAYLFIALGIWAGVSCFLQTFMFSVAGDNLTRRLRTMTFSAMLKQECAWFDSPKNNTGALCTRLAVDAANVQGATGSRIGILLQSVGSVVIALILALFLVWKQALVTAVFMPLVLVATYYQGKFMIGQTDDEIKSQEGGGKVASEAINNIRTVAALCREDKFTELYTESLMEARRNFCKATQIRAVIFGFSQSLPCVSYAVSMWYGGYLIEEDGVSYENVFKIGELLIFGIMMVGQSVAMAPNYNKGLMSAARIYKILDRKPRLQTDNKAGLRLPDISDASVEFNGVQFSYPMRPQVSILQGLSFKVQNGLTIALVGSSGCGKSTCIQLLERFYQPSNGTVLFGGYNVWDLNNRWLRNQMGLVSQEPVLFDRTISENIAYGDNTREVHMDEIIQAAKQANIHSFISALPKGYSTPVGNKGTHLSGGQKQRIAIARALVRNPKILLLDEATSALDSESEKLVQEALEKAAKNRTTIIVAHRLSTIQKADFIIYIHQGRVAEFGTHQELLENKGFYYQLYTQN